MKKIMLLLAVVMLSGCVAGEMDKWYRSDRTRSQTRMEWQNCNQRAQQLGFWRWDKEIRDECMREKGFTKKEETGSTIVITGDKGQGKVGVREYGIVTINSTPEKADIFLDNALIGNTPAARLKLEAGDHVLEIRKSGYKLWKNSIKVLLDSETTINAELGK
jgi:hypothetical protein